MNIENSINHGARLVISIWITALITFTLLISVIASWPNVVHILIGSDVGFLKILGSVLTPIAAIIGIHLLNRRTKTSDMALSQTRAAVRRDQFAKGVELLRFDDEPSRIAGAHVLQTLADIDPDRFLVPVTNVFISFLSVRERYNREIVGPAKSGRKFNWSKLKRTDIDCLVVIHGMGKIRHPNTLAWSSETIGEGYRTTVTNLNLIRVFISDANFSNVDFENCHFAQVSFINCNFTNARISASVHISLDFQKCDLSNSEILVKCAALDSENIGTAEVKFQGCNVKNTVLNNQPMRYGDSVRQKLI